MPPPDTKLKQSVSEHHSLRVVVIDHRSLNKGPTEPNSASQATVPRKKPSKKITKSKTNRTGCGSQTFANVLTSRLPCHHVNHIIMSTTHQQVVGKRNSSETCDFTGENTLRETPCFFGKVTPGVAKGGSLLTRA